MTVSSTINRMFYTGNGSLKIYAYSFLIYDSSHLQVYVDGVLKTITTDYSVSGVGNPSGGNVTFVTAPANGAIIVIMRVVPLLQNTDYVAHDSFPAETHEKALDLLVMIAQQLNMTWGYAAPTSGTWIKGAICWNISPSASNPPGWVCVTGGTPGTWKAMSNLAA